MDLIGSTCGIESEVVARATTLDLDDVGSIPVARAEELLAMKVLSSSDRRPQDRLDILNLLLYGEDLDLPAVRDNVRRIMERGFHRDEDLLEKLDRLLPEAAASR